MWVVQSALARSRRPITRSRQTDSNQRYRNLIFRALLRNKRRVGSQIRRKSRLMKKTQRTTKKFKWVAQAPISYRNKCCRRLRMKRRYLWAKEGCTVLKCNSTKEAYQTRDQKLQEPSQLWRNQYNCLQSLDLDEHRLVLPMEYLKDSLFHTKALKPHPDVSSKASAATKLWSFFA